MKWKTTLLLQKITVAYPIKRYLTFCGNWKFSSLLYLHKRTKSLPHSGPVKSVCRILIKILILSSHWSVDQIERNEMGWACSTYSGWGEVCTGFWWGNLRERGHLEGPDVDERIKLRWIFRKLDVGLWTGSSWLRIGTGGGSLWMR